MRTLRKSKTAEILLRLLDGPKYVRELLSDVGGSAQTVEMRIHELLSDGLVEEEEWEAWPFRKMLKLTERGKEVARLLKLEEGFFGKSVGKIMSKDIVERGKLLLALLHAVGGSIIGAIRLEKLVFLLGREHGVETPYKFIPYQFGPYSSDVLQDAIDLEMAGYVGINAEVLEPTLAGDSMVRKKYGLTSKGAKVAREIYEKLPKEVKHTLSSMKRFNEMSQPELLNYVYTKYPKESRGV